MARVLSCIQPTGEVTLGNHLGALRNWVSAQRPGDSFYGIVDLHALTANPDPGVVGRQTLELAAILFAVGLDPEISTVFVQSHVPEHTRLAWVTECTVSCGELSRMTQFKEKSARQDGGFIPGGLFTYPALMAADILLYDTDEVPVGDDQRQHVEITRDIAMRFNARYGEVFVVPRAVMPAAGARVMDLQNPAAKMSKSMPGPGLVRLLDPPREVEKKFKRAVTDSDQEVRYDREAKPGVSNLLEILAAVTGGDPRALAGEFTQYGPLKARTAEAVIAMLEPIQARYAQLTDDPAELTRLLRVGATKARAVAGATYGRVSEAIGFVPAG